MPTPSGQLGGYYNPGGLTPGAETEGGDLENARPGLVRHYRFHEKAGSTSAASERGGSALASAPWGSGPQDPVFGGVGPHVTGVQLPVLITSSTGTSHAALIDAAASGEWATALTGGGSIEFWYRLDALPWIDYDNPSTFALLTVETQAIGFFGAHEVLTIGDPATDIQDPWLIIFVWPTWDQEGNVTYRMLMWSQTVGVGLGDVGDLGWHHYRVTWSVSRNYLHGYRDGTLVSSNSCPLSLRSAAPGGAKLRLAGNDFGNFWRENGEPYKWIAAPANVHAGNPAGSHFWMGISNGGAAGTMEDLAIYSAPTDLSEFASSIAVSAATSFKFGLAPHACQNYTLTATTAVDFGITTILCLPTKTTSFLTEVIRTGNYRGRVTQAFIEVLMDAPRPTYHASAGTGFDLGAVAWDRIALSFDVSAATTFDLATDTWKRIAVDFNLAAASGFCVGDTISYQLNNDIFVFVRTGMDFRAPGDATVYTPQNYDLAATTGLDFLLATYAARDWYQSVTTGLGIGSQQAVYNTAKPVAAYSGLVFGVRTGTALNHAYHVSAATLLRVGNATAVDLNQAFSVSATTGLSLGSAGKSIGQFFRQSVTTGLSFAHAARNNRDAVAQATTRFDVAARTTKGRDVFASATTGLGMASSDHSNQHPQLSTATGFVLYVTVGAVVSVTEAATGFELTHLAEAVVELPWRRANLTLPPGGQIPH